MIPNSLPSHWQIKKLGEVCEKIIGGGTPSTNNTNFWNGNIPWITSADITGLKQLKARKFITQEAIKKSASNLLPKDGIVVVTRIGLGKLAIAPFDLSFSQDNHGLILDKKYITNEYALWALSKVVQVFKTENRGTTIKGVTKKQLVELDIPLPPLPEQEAIVAKIESLFAELEAGKSALLAAREQIKLYRQSLLKAAFEGKLTEKSKKPLETGQLPEGWKWVKLGEVCDVRDGTHDSPKYVTEGFPLVTSKNIKNGEIDFSNVNYITEQDFIKINQRSKVENNDILMPMIGTIGNPILVNKTREFAIKNVALIKNIGFINQVYVKYILDSYFFDNYILQHSKGNTQKFLALGQIRAFELPFPPLLTQEKIVAILEEKLGECDALDATIEKSLTDAELLRQSILKEAFEGRLVKMDV